MANNPTVVIGSLNDEELKKSIDKLVNHVDQQLNYMVSSTKVAVMSMNKSLKSLGDTKIDFGGSADGGASKRTKAQNAETVAAKESTQAYKDKKMTLDQQASAINTAIQSEKKYTEEIRRQAQTIRETQTWKEKGYAIVGENSYYDPESSKASRKDVLSLEEQILKNTQQREEAEKKVSNVLKEEVETLNVARNGFKIDNSSKEGQGVKSIAAQKQAAEAAAKETNYLKEQVASLLDMEEREIKTANATSSSYAQLAQYLKHLQTAYQRLGADRIAKGEGTDIANEIQKTQRAMQKLQQTMNRPISFAAAMKGDEKTLDDIAYKMQRLRSYRQGIDLTKPNAANEIKQVDEALAKLQKDADKWMSKSQEMIKSNTALGRSWNYMKNRLAFYFTVGAGTQFIKNLIEVRSQYEMNERALGILINSAERGTQIFNELSQMALVSPYTLIELSAAAKQLTAYDIAARDVVDTTRRLADMAAAVGIPIERLTYALGQIKAYGYLNSRDARMFANAGIPLVKQLSDYYTELEGKMVSTADVYDRMKKKAIDYNSVMAVVTKMTDEGGKFFDFQAKMADTLKVRLANLTLAWNNMLNDMGKETQGVLTWSIGALRSLFLQWKNLYGALNEVALVFGVAKALQFLGVCAHAAGIGFGSLNKYMTLNSLLGTRLATTVRTLGNAFMSLVRSPLAWFTMAALLVTEIGDAFFNADRATKEFNKSLREGAKTTYEDLKKFAEQYKNVRDSLYTTQKTAIGNIYDPSTGKAAATAYANQTVGQDISASEAKKVWEAMREQIELSSHASDEYISKLLSIENVSERLRQGFQILDDIQTVSAALKEIGEDGIKVTQSWAAWWNAWQGADGLIDNVKDLQKEIQRLQDAGQDPNDKFTKVIDKDYATALERFRKDLKVTTDSVIDFINLNGWSGDTGKIDEVFKQVTDRLATKGNLDPQTAFTLQREVEVARAKAAKEALEIRIADEKKALATASDEISKQQIQKNLETLEQQKRDFDKFNGENRAYWNDFTKYIKERHISELTAAYNSMTDHGKKAMDFQSEEWQKRVHDWANRYEKSHNLATDSVFNRLRNWINDANTWSVFIKMTISTEDGKSVYKQLEEYDKAADDAWKTMQRLDKRIAQLRKKGAKEIENSENVGVTDLSLISEDDKELTKAIEERTQAQKDYNEAVAKGGESKKENAADRKAAKQAESELAKALKDELSTIEKVRSIYKDLTKEGMSHVNAVERATRGWNETVNAINKVLQKNGLKKLDLSKFAGIENPRELVNMLQSQLNTLLKHGAKPAEIKELQTKVNTLEVDADKYDLTKITKGLNSELDRLKEEYELAVALDADPELGSIFADWMGFDMDNLPRTAQEYANQATNALNKALKKRDADLELPNLLNITDDDLRELQNRVGTGGITQTYVDEITKAVKDVRGVFKKEKEDTSKEWNALIEKYGGLQAKLLKIYKDTVQQQSSIVKQFGSDEQISQALDLVRKIQISQDPADIARLQEQLAKIINDITKNNPIALKTYQATQNEQKREESKAYWENFKESDLYAMTFEDVANLSNRAIDMMIEKLDELKDKVKESPESMKALIKAKNDLEEAKNIRDPFGGMIRGLKMSVEASKEAKTARDQLAQADIRLKNAEKNLEDAKASKDVTAIAKAEQEVAKAKEKRETAQKNLTNAENKGKKAQNNFVQSAQALSQNMQTMGDIANQTAEIFRMFGENDTADAIAEIGSAFTSLIPTIVAVAVAIKMLESTSVILLAISAAISAVIGLVSFFSGQSNKRITEKVEESERAVKRLENSYKMLEYAAEQAFGAATSGAQQALKANKELQLFELRRQLALEQSRTGKNYDEDKVLDLKGQIIDLENEIKDFTKGAVNDLLGISSHGDFFENMISEMIDAFKSGEDAMKVFEEKWSKMIDNMIMKTIVSQVLQNWVNSLEKGANDILEKYTKEQSDAIANMNNKMTDFSLMDARDAALWVAENDKKEYENILNQLKKDRILSGFNPLYDAMLINYNEDIQKRIQDAYIANMQSQINGINSKLDKASLDATGELIDYYGRAGEEFKANYLDVILDKIKENWNFGQDSENKLSQLQQGIQSVSETTASALEGYMNGVSQQVYYHSELLTQIRDAIVGTDSDIQLGVQGQMLLQLQQSYQVQMSIENILQGVLNPSGRAFSVELLS